MAFADEKGIAILNTRGFLTEYARELSELAEEKRCNIAILTDLIHQDYLFLPFWQMLIE